MYLNLCGGVHPEHGLTPGVTAPLHVVLRHELVVQLAPLEYVAPVTEVVGNARQSVPPRLHHRLGLVHRVLSAVKEGLMDKRRLVQLHNLKTIRFKYLQLHMSKGSP